VIWSSVDCKIWDRKSTLYPNISRCVLYRPGSCLPAWLG